MSRVGKLAETQLELLFFGVFFKIFLLRTIFKVFMELVKHCFCLMFRFFGRQAHGILALTRSNPQFLCMKAKS